MSGLTPDIFLSCERNQQGLKDCSAEIKTNCLRKIIVQDNFNPATLASLRTMIAGSNYEKVRRYIPPQGTAKKINGYSPRQRYYR